MKKFFLMAAVVVCALLVSVTLLARFPVGMMNRSPKEIQKIGIIMNGSIEDRSYSQAQYDAIMEVVEEKNLEVICREKIAADENFITIAEELIQDGCGIIFCDNYLFDIYLKELAAAHSDIYFMNASGTETADNLSSYLGRVYQARYLTGLIAGLETKTNEIGYILACLTPETIRQLNAFTIGVKKVNPDAKVFVRRTDDWNDSEKAAAETLILLSDHDIDILTQHVNPISPLRVADERGVKIIGNNYDNHELFPRTYLTACAFNWKPFFEARMRECLDHEFIGRHYWEDIESGLVYLAPVTELVSPEAEKIAEEELKRLISGEFDVFFGPLTDIYGAEQVREGENLSDQRLLYDMYWFTDGVVMES